MTIAVPTELHREIALPFLERGISVLVEKPMARSLAEADEMIAAARASGATLAVGHTERYNPAVAAVMPLVTSPRFIEVHRLGVFPERSLDIDVVFDLMIHDLDVILSLVRSEVASVEAVGVPVLTPKYDIANARLRFASGCIANVTASRISKDRVRKIRFFQPDAYLSIDYAAQEVEGWRLVRRDGARPSIEGGPIPVERDEPLRVELADFVRAVRERSTPRVDGAAGRRALAWRRHRGEDGERRVDVQGSESLHRRPRQRARARADRRAGQSGPRDLRRDRPCVEVARRRTRAALRDSPPATTCRSPSTCSAR